MIKKTRISYKNNWAMVGSNFWYKKSYLEK